MKSVSAIAAVIAWIPTISSAACPMNMRVGTYAIDHYSATGDAGTGSDLSHQINMANQFTDRAFDIVAGYCATATTGKTFFLNDAQVTKNHWKNLADPATTGTSEIRENTDFIFYAGHGTTTNPRKLYLGANDATYGTVGSGDFTMGGLGGKNNRWFIAHSCAAFPRPPIATSPQQMWKGIFRGLRAMLGFESYIYDNWDGWGIAYHFWANWTWNNWSIWESFYNAEFYFGYKSLGGSGLHPGCLSGYPGDYCLESFTSTTNAPAPNINAGAYHSLVAGAPIYP